MPCTSVECRKNKKITQAKVFTINETSTAFSNKFDETQEELEILASMDDLLSG